MVDVRNVGDTYRLHMMVDVPVVDGPFQGRMERMYDGALFDGAAYVLVANERVYDPDTNSDVGGGGPVTTAFYKVARTEAGLYYLRHEDKT